MIEILGYIFAGILTVGLGILVYVVLGEILAHTVLTSAKFSIYEENFRSLQRKINELETRLENLEPKDKQDER